MKKLTILVDMDDTIEHLLDAWTLWLDEKYGFDVHPDDVTDWDITKFFPGLTREQVWEPLKIGSFFRSIRPVEGAAEALQRLKNDGHTVYVVTASNYETIPEKMDDVLFRWFPFFTWEDVILTHNKQLLKADVLVDDGIHNHIGGDYHKILLERAYNKDFDAEANGMVRVKNWTEIEAEIRRFAEQEDEAQ